MDKDTSFASCAQRLLGRARKVIPKALTKQAAVRPLVKASIPAQKPRNNLVPPVTLKAPVKNACKLSHSLIKPLSGGRAEIAIAPIKKQKAV